MWAQKLLYIFYLGFFSDLYLSSVIRHIHFSRGKQNIAGALKCQTPDANTSLQLYAPERSPAPEPSCAHQGLALT